MLGKDEYHGVWIYIEHRHGIVNDVSWELLSEGRRLAEELETNVSGVIVGNHVSGIIEEAFHYGADQVYVVDDAVFEPYRARVHAEVLVQLVQEHRPEILLLGATALGRELSGVVATRLETGLTADCTGLQIDVKTKRLLRQSRPAFGGNIVATIITPNSYPQMATVRPRAVGPPSYNKLRNGKIIKFSTDPDLLGFDDEVLRLVEETNFTISLENADIIISGGKGLGSAEDFKIIEDLARILNAQVGASRAAVNARWIGQEHQIGQTGKIVRPKLYIAVGISGAVQHLVGMEHSDIIVAINADPEAPIMKIADIPVVGDLFKIIPNFIEVLRSRPEMLSRIRQRHLQTQSA